MINQFENSYKADALLAEANILSSAIGKIHIFINFMLNLHLHLQELVLFRNFRTYIELDLIHILLYIIPA